MDASVIDKVDKGSLIPSERIFLPLFTSHRGVGIPIAHSPLQPSFQNLNNVFLPFYSLLNFSFGHSDSDSYRASGLWERLCKLFLQVKGLAGPLRVPSRYGSLTTHNHP